LHQHAVVALREASKKLIDAQADIALGSVLRSTIDAALQSVQDARDAIYELRRRSGITTRLRAQLAPEDDDPDTKR
jgi:hypothetical protein